MARFIRIDNTRHSQRASSWDTTGGNWDRLSINRGEIVSLLDTKEPGCITHIWFTCASVQDDFLRNPFTQPEKASNSKYGKLEAAKTPVECPASSE